MLRRERSWNEVYSEEAEEILKRAEQVYLGYRALAIGSMCVMIFVVWQARRAKERKPAPKR